MQGDEQRWLFHLPFRREHQKFWHGFGLDSLLSPLAFLYNPTETRVIPDKCQVWIPEEPPFSPPMATFQCLL